MEPRAPNLKARPRSWSSTTPQLPLTTSHPQLSSFSWLAQTLAFANFTVLRDPTRAIRCASVMKEPSTVSWSPLSKNLASSVLTLTDSPGAEKKLYSWPFRPRKSALPPWAKVICGSWMTWLATVPQGTSRCAWGISWAATGSRKARPSSSANRRDMAHRSFTPSVSGFDRKTEKLLKALW